MKSFRLALIAIALVVAGEASARVQMKRSYPEANAHTMFRFEPEVQLEFTETVVEPQISVKDFKGRELTCGTPSLDEAGDLALVRICAPQPPRPFQGGEYTVNWQVKSRATGELSRDSFKFHIHDHP